jgi:glycosyltransferase involved in cell wall biosynthesis
MNRMNFMTVKDHLAEIRAINLGCEATRVMILPSWCDTELFTPMARSNLLRKQWGANSDTLVVLYVRPLNAEYRSRVLIDAMKEVLAETDGVKFLIANRGNPSWVEYAAKSGAVIVPKIPHSQMHFYLASSDVSVDTYYPEFDVGGHGHGTNFVESLSTRTPAIVPDRPEYKSSWMCGAKLYKTGDSKSLAESIFAMTNVRERTKLGIYGREGVESFASEKVCLGKMEKIYKELSD